MSECKCSGNCSSNATTKTVYACAGASNVGKMSYDLAIVLNRQKRYGLSCATGVGADLSGFVDGAKSESTLNLLIDGCPVGCLKLMFDNKGITNYDHVVITEMGIKKEGNLDYDPSIIDQLLIQINDSGL
jgi:uncharacterized metal-binding protein